MAFTLEEARQIGEDVGIDWDEAEFTLEDFQVGLDIELEHGTKVSKKFNVTEDDPRLTGMVTWVHLTETPLYYDEQVGLPDLEDRLEDEGEEEFDRGELVMATYDPKANEQDRAQELLQGATSVEVYEVVQGYLNRLKRVKLGYDHVKEQDLLPGEHRVPVSITDVLEKASELLLAMVQAEDEFIQFMDESGEYPEEDRKEGGMDRAEGATFRTSSILHNGQVYVAKRRYGPEAWV